MWCLPSRTWSYRRPASSYSRLPPQWFIKALRYTRGSIKRWRNPAAKNCTLEIHRDVDLYTAGIEFVGSTLCVGRGQRKKKESSSWLFGLMMHVFFMCIKLGNGFFFFFVIPLLCQLTKEGQGEMYGAFLSVHKRGGVCSGVWIGTGRGRRTLSSFLARLSRTFSV